MFDFSDLWGIYEDLYRISEDLVWLARIRALHGWQTCGANTVTAMTGDVWLPKEKPRPPAGGLQHITPNPGLVPILEA